ncbi:MAG: hypothetical protein OEU32_10075 [Acidimicrobiia bacterium]|nr:hypothetical protein [Acidimicrobiia bacterium]
MTDTQEHISRDDIENKFVELQQSVDTASAGARDTAKKVGLVALLLLLILAYILGRKRGKAGKTVVEVRRL